MPSAKERVQAAFVSYRRGALADPEFDAGGEASNEFFDLLAEAGWTPDEDFEDWALNATPLECVVRAAFLFGQEGGQ